MAGETLNRTLTGEQLKLIEPLLQKAYPDLMKGHASGEIDHALDDCLEKAFSDFKSTLLKKIEDQSWLEKQFAKDLLDKDEITKAKTFFNLENVLKHEKVRKEVIESFGIPEDEYDNYIDIISNAQTKALETLHTNQNNQHTKAAVQPLKQEQPKRDYTSVRDKEENDLASAGTAPSADELIKLQQVLGTSTSGSWDNATKSKLIVTATGFMDGQNITYQSFKNNLNQTVSQLEQQHATALTDLNNKLDALNAIDEDKRLETNANFVSARDAYNKVLTDNPEIKTYQGIKALQTALTTSFDPLLTKSFQSNYAQYLVPNYQDMHFILHVLKDEKSAVKTALGGELPTLSAQSQESLIFDKEADIALKNFMTALASKKYGLDIAHHRESNSLISYNPVLGQAVRRSFKDALKEDSPKAEAIVKMLKDFDLEVKVAEAGDESGLDDDEKKKSKKDREIEAASQSIDKLFDAFDRVYDRGNIMGKQRKIKIDPKKDVLSNMEQHALVRLVQNVRTTPKDLNDPTSPRTDDPNQVLMLDGMMRMLTGNFTAVGWTPTKENPNPALGAFKGGYGLLDLAPALKEKDVLKGVVKDLKGIDKLDPAAQISASIRPILQSLKDCPDKESFDKRLDEIKKRAEANAEKLKTIPRDPIAKRKEQKLLGYNNSLDLAFIYLSQQNVIQNFNPSDPNFSQQFDEAIYDTSNVFADSFIDKTQDVHKNFSNNKYETNPKMMLDQTVIASLQESGFELADTGPNYGDKDNLTPMQLMQHQAERVMDAYINLNKGEDIFSHQPLIFQDKNGKSYIAGMDRDTNTFFIEKFPLANINADLDGASLEDGEYDVQKQLCADYPGYQLAHDNYMMYFQDIRKGDNTITSGRAIYESVFRKIQDPDESNFSKIESNAVGHSNRQSAIDSLRSAQMTPEELEKTRKQLSAHLLNYKRRQNANIQNYSHTGLEPTLEELEYMQKNLDNGPLMNKMLKDKPRTFINGHGGYIAFSKVDNPDSFEQACALDLRDEMNNFLNLPLKERMEIRFALNAANSGPNMDEQKRKDHEKLTKNFRKEFPNLHVLADNYSHIGNAVEAAEVFMKQYNLNFSYGSPRSHLPAVVRQYEPSEYESLLMNTQNAPRVVTDPDTGKVYLLARDNDKPLKLGDDLNMIAVPIRANSAKAGLNINEDKLKEIAGNYPDWSADEIKQSLLKNQDVVGMLDIKIPDPETTPELEKKAAVN